MATSRPTSTSASAPTSHLPRVLPRREPSGAECRSAADPRSLDCVVVTHPMRHLTAHPSAMLLIAQLAQVLAYPFLGESRVGGAVIGVIGMLAVGPRCSPCGVRPT